MWKVLVQDLAHDSHSMAADGCYKLGFLTSALLTFWAQHFFAVVCCPVYYRRSNSTPGLYPRYSPQQWQSEMAPDIARCPPPTSGEPLFHLRKGGWFLLGVLGHGVDTFHISVCFKWKKETHRKDTFGALPHSPLGSNFSNWIMSSREWKKIWQ